MGEQRLLCTSIPTGSRTRDLSTPHHCHAEAPLCDVNITLYAYISMPSRLHSITLIHSQVYFPAVTVITYPVCQMADPDHRQTWSQGAIGRCCIASIVIAEGQRSLHAPKFCLSRTVNTPPLFLLDRSLISLVYLRLGLPPFLPIDSLFQHFSVRVFLARSIRPKYCILRLCAVVSRRSCVSPVHHVSLLH